MSVHTPAKHTFSGSVPLQRIHFPHLTLIHAGFWGVNPPNPHTSLAKSEGLTPPGPQDLKTCRIHPPLLLNQLGRGIRDHNVKALIGKQGADPEEGIVGSTAKQNQNWVANDGLYTKQCECQRRQFACSQATNSWFVNRYWVFIRRIKLTPHRWVQAPAISNTIAITKNMGMDLPFPKLTQTWELAIVCKKCLPTPAHSLCMSMLVGQDGTHMRPPAHKDFVF